MTCLKSEMKTEALNSAEDCEELTILRLPGLAGRARELHSRLLSRTPPDRNVNSAGCSPHVENGVIDVESGSAKEGDLLYVTLSKD